ncbi:MAG: fumarylacetoacetate hydrolase family protein, partial [Cyanobacteriota bacterium]|nr:fumarylacetoacetate hydrolase family protein [Cyanobacteriota bacterium]
MDLFAELTPTGEEARIGRVLAPVWPTAIFCIGLNYRRHAAETGAALPERPVVFMKSPGATQDPGEPITLPTALASGQVDYEGELAVVIGRRCKNVSRDEALAVVAGFTCGNDVSARDWQKQWGGGQWCRGKTFDTFAP